MQQRCRLFSESAVCNRDADAARAKINNQDQSKHAGPSTLQEKKETQKKKRQGKKKA
jgi:hypothetical protein